MKMSREIYYILWRLSNSMFTQNFKIIVNHPETLDLHHICYDYFSGLSLVLIWHTNKIISFYRSYMF